MFLGHPAVHCLRPQNVEVTVLVFSNILFHLILKASLEVGFLIPIFP